MILKYSQEIFNYLNTDGKIIKMLFDGPVTAGEIYGNISKSQPVISKKLARLQDQGLIVCRRDGNDRRVVWYELSGPLLAKMLDAPAEGYCQTNQHLVRDRDFASQR